MFSLKTSYPELEFDLTQRTSDEPSGGSDVRVVTRGFFEKKSIFSTRDNNRVFDYAHNMVLLDKLPINCVGWGNLSFVIDKNQKS